MEQWWKSYLSPFLHEKETQFHCLETYPTLDNIDWDTLGGLSWLSKFVMKLFKERSFQIFLLEVGCAQLNGETTDHLVLQRSLRKHRHLWENKSERLKECTSFIWRTGNIKYLNMTQSQEFTILIWDIFLQMIMSFLISATHTNNVTVLAMHLCAQRQRI